LKIHPTAFVDPAAEIGEDAQIGCFAVVEAGAKIGDRCTLEGHAQVLSHAEIGDDCLVGGNSIIGGAPQDLGFDSRVPSKVRIGPGNTFRENVTIHRSTTENGVTEIGSNNYFMVGTHVGHDCVIGERNILANQCMLGGHVVLGDGAFLGGGAGLHQFVRIGSLCMIKGNASISQDVPPYVIISDSNRVRGLNVIGMRRAGMNAATRKNVKEAFHQMFLNERNLQEALDDTLPHEWEPEAQAFIDFFRGETTRGVCRP
jgi:UDP-N-acetylglucosamine acyltransferase